VTHHLDQDPVLADPLGLIFLHPLTLGEGRQGLVHVGALPGGEQEITVTADDLGCGVTVDSLGSRVPALDHTVGVQGEHRVVGELDYRCQSRRGLCGLHLRGNVPGDG
jgi:hypothetical protein